MAGGRTGRVHVVDWTDLSVEEVMAAARDFSPRRERLWPDVHLDLYTVHDVGESHAEVTEGNQDPLLGHLWERLRYDWSEDGRIIGTVIDSNIFRPGGTWELRATREAGRTKVEIVAVRHMRGAKGLVIWFFIKVGYARRYVAGHLRHFLNAATHSP